MTSRSYHLTRRGALVALSALGITTVGGMTTTHWGGSVPDDEDLPLGHSEIHVLISLAEVLYPSGVTGVPEFVELYWAGRSRSRPEYANEAAATIHALDTHARQWRHSPFVELSHTDRDHLLREMKVNIAVPNPTGAVHERIRYYLVNELLFALFTSPTGGRLVGIENPQGYPGGSSSYRRGPRNDW